MIDESENLQQQQQIDPQTLENYLEILCEKLQALHETMRPRRKNYLRRSSGSLTSLSMHSELRTLNFWRAVISECLASFFYNLLVCGALTGAGPGATTSNLTIITAFASGFTIIALTQCFGSISGAFINPAIIVAALITRHLSFVRAIVYVMAQCGGAIAAAALLYGISIIGHQNSLLSSTYLLGINASERFGLEFVLTLLLTLVFLMSRFLHRRLFDISPITIGAAYTACTFVSLPHLNPARSLGPAFVLNRWDMHWVFWLGPILGAFSAALIYEFIYDNDSLNGDDSMRDVTAIVDVDCSTIDSETDTYDDLRQKSKMHVTNTTTTTISNNKGGSGGATTAIAKRAATLTAHKQFNNSSSYFSVGGVGGGVGGSGGGGSTLEPIYGGTKSLYCKSPPLTRANLNRSQSVYTKSNTMLNNNHSSGKDDPATLYRSGHLLPTQSPYPIRYANLPTATSHNGHYPISDHLLYNNPPNVTSSIVYSKSFEHGDTRRHNTAAGAAATATTNTLPYGTGSRLINPNGGGGGGGGTSDDSNYCLSFLNSASSSQSRFNANKNVCRNNPY